MALTQARASGAFTGRRYGSFADKATDAHPVGRLTQLRPFGAHSGSLYGSFAGRAAAPPPPSSGGVGLGVMRRVRVPPQVVDELRQQLIDEDELMLLMAAHIAGSGLLH